MARVAVIEDNPDLREEITTYLAEVGFETFGYGSAEELYRDLISNQFDVAVVDIGLPGEDGLSLTQHLRRSLPMGVIILSAKGQTEDRILGFERGADLYFVKPVDYRELASAIRGLARRVGGVAEDTFWTVVHATRKLVAPNQLEVELTTGEFKLLTELAKALGEPVSRDHLLRTFGRRLDISETRMFDTLVHRLRVKIEKGTGASPPLKTEHGFGYSFAGLRLR